MDTWPLEVIFTLLPFCDARTVYYFRGVCGRFRAVITDDSLLPVLKKLVTNRDTTNLNLAQVLHLCRYPYTIPRMVTDTCDMFFIKEQNVYHTDLPLCHNKGDPKPQDRYWSGITDIAECDNVFCILRNNRIFCYYEGNVDKGYQLEFEAIQVSVAESRYGGCSILILSRDNRAYFVKYREEYDYTTPVPYLIPGCVRHIEDDKIIDFAGRVWRVDVDGYATPTKDVYSFGAKSKYRGELEANGIDMKDVDQIFTGGAGCYYLVMKDGSIDEVATNGEGRVERKKYPHFSF